MSYWVIGCGLIGTEYAKCLRAIGENPVVIGRGEASARLCEEAIETKVVRGGLEKFLSASPAMPKGVIVATPVQNLFHTTKQLVDYGIQYILLEKPAASTYEEIETLRDYCTRNKAEVFICYNRRHYQSVIKAREIIANDGGVKSFSFDFTEWAHMIGEESHPMSTKQRWFLVNSTHVINLAFHLGGQPKEMHTFTAGGLPWHSAGSIYTGAGVTDEGALFSYHSNWEAPGRWGLEFHTLHHKLVFRPVEKLQIQKHGSVAIEPVEIDYDLDTRFKPGFYLLTKDFVAQNREALFSLDNHCDSLVNLKKIQAYPPQRSIPKSGNVSMAHP